MKTKSKSDNDLPIKKTIKLNDMVIFDRQHFMKAANAIPKVL